MKQKSVNVILRGIVVAMFFMGPMNIFAGGAPEPQAGGAQAAPDKVYELTIASLEPIGAPTTLSVEYMAKLAQEKSGGRLRINSNPGGVLGTGLQLMESVSMGSIDMVSIVLEWYAPFVKDVNIYVMGFTFRDNDHFRKFLNSPIFKNMKQEIFDTTGVRVLADNWIGLPRCLVSKKPVKSPGDIANIKMRVPEIESYVKVWKGLGTNPTRVAWAEVYLALKTGTVDAAEGPLDQMYATKFYEAANYITLTNHMQQAFTIGINDSKYQSLPADLRKILDEVSLEAGEYYQKLIQDEFQINRQKMLDGGAVINSVDTVPFQKMLEPVIKEAEETKFWTPGLYQKVQDIR
jgi:tripartite ATP-independent transporter DctP family solute receptor